jgi:hypothetical protein
VLYSSRDLLFTVLAFCVLWLTILVSWALYYVALMLRDAYRTFGEVRERLSTLDLFVRKVTEKLEHTTSYLGLLVEGFGRLLTFLQERRELKPSRRRRDE